MTICLSNLVKQEKHMIKKKIGWLLLFAICFTFGVKAQQATSMRINEVLVINEDNFVDDYGKRHGWIELYNSSAGAVNIAGCFLTDDKENPRKYPIPKGDVTTLIQPGQHALFWADNMPDRGTYHISFSFDPTKENYVALYNADGKTLIDEVTIPAGQVADISYGRVIDGQDEWGQLKKVTPRANNVTLDTNEKIENFSENDSWGVGMTITAMAVVFLGLFLLYVIFKYIGNLSIQASKRNAQKTAGDRVISADAGQESGEIFAAIATALYEMSDDNHDIENTVLTIRKVKRAYSPWSSKLYGLRQTPIKK